MSLRKVWSELQSRFEELDELFKPSLHSAERRKICVSDVVAWIHQDQLPINLLSLLNFALIGQRNSLPLLSKGIVDIIRMFHISKVLVSKHLRIRTSFLEILSTIKNKTDIHEYQRQQ